ncbi:MAG: hypothetical protein K2O18_15380 [Oscillospiraceae bacterium]|nr:hypothetical protein [Oscillospiraceae bacterium]
MNKRIRKKHLKRAVCELVAAYEEYETARERVFLEAVQKVADTYGMSKTAFRCYLEIAWIMTLSGPPPKFLMDRNRQSNQDTQH